jgi:hypothetical protein
LFQVYGEQIARLSAEDPRQRASDPEWQRLTAALDAVSQQRDSFASRLYWYTDLEEARAAARASGKPILSLRLLGNLSEEFSCANSRFFRSILYANAAVSTVLRERFILHWKSVRPAPRVTIDFGDGRKIERTLTGNSIHYILDSEGRPIDAIPGLYGPAAFLRLLNQALTAFQSVAGQPTFNREARLRAYHQSSRRSIATDFERDVALTGAHLNPQAPLAGADVITEAPSAVQAAPRAITKMGGEIKTLKSIGTADPYLVAPPLLDYRGGAPALVSAENDLVEWEKIAVLHAADSRLDDASIALICSQYPSIGPGDARMSRILKSLERYLAIDAVRNQYLMHARLHQWLANGWLWLDVESLNERVYASLFLTPNWDPWLGLVSPDTYIGLIDDGIVSAGKARQ